MKIKLFEEYSKNILTAKEIIEYIGNITPYDSDVPDYYFSIIEKSNKVFHRTEVLIKDLLAKDESLKEYVDSKENRYDNESSYEPSSHELDNPIVIFNNEVIDGYNRVAVHHRNGDEKIIAYVSN